MPAILDAADVDAWLDAKIDFRDLQPMLKPSRRNFRISDAAPVAPKAAKLRAEPRQASLF